MAAFEVYTFAVALTEILLVFRGIWFQEQCLH